MGSQSFQHYIKAPDARTAFRDLCEAATDEHGHDPYNGTINTCELGGCVLAFPGKFKESNKARALKKADEAMRSTIGKRCACYIDLGTCGAHIREAVVERSKDAKPPRFERRYEVVQHLVGREDCARTFKTKSEAISYAKELAVKDGPDFWNIQINICMEAVSGQPNLATVRMQSRTATRAPKKQKPGQRFVENHLFLFFGWAAC